MSADTARPAQVEPGQAPSAHKDLSNWPLLFATFRQYATDNWLARCERHAEVSPQEMLAVTALRVQAHTREFAQQLAQWQAEGNQAQLIQWLVQGPWNLPEIQHRVDLSQLSKVEFLPLLEKSPARTSKFDVTQTPGDEADAAPDAPCSLSDQSHWVTRSEPAAQEPVLAPCQLLITDQHGQRALGLTHRHTLLGQEKTVQLPTGETLQLSDQMLIPWQGEQALFVAVPGTHVSGLHLWIHRREDSVVFQDVGSTNGSFGESRLSAQHWHDVDGQRTLHLGGPQDDSRADSPCIEIRCNLLTPRSVQGTPLRAAVQRPAARPLAVLTCANAAGSPLHFQVLRTPFVIGRSPESDGVVPPEHEMVSRKHLVIEEVDVVSQRILVRDISRHHLTVCDRVFPADFTRPTWVPLEATLLLGASSRFTGFSLLLTSISSTEK